MNSPETNEIKFTPDEFDEIQRLAERRGLDVRTLILELVSAELDRRDAGVKDEVFTDGIEHLIGSVEGPSDLSSNRRRLDGLGS